MKRVKIVFSIFSAAAVLLTARLFYIGVIKNGTLTEQAVAQRTQSISFESPRGIIYDRNMVRITNAQMELVCSGDNPYYIDEKSGGFLSHVIGYISPDGKGSGIEGAFDYVLAPDGKSKISYLKDINNNRISKGYAVDTKKSYKGIALTIDSHIQKITENAMDKYGINGAAVVVDCKSGGIAAMASRPNFDRTNLASYLNGTDGELVNKAICAYNPGSVFKIVVAAAALENSIAENVKYFCNGVTEIDGTSFVCHNEDGHGEQDLNCAFANSCNCAFYKIGSEVGADRIYKYATAFGIGSEVLKINGISEDVGCVPKEVSSEAELANISIGQGDVMLTPLQAADMLCTICNGGVRRQIALIKGIVDESGECREVASSETGRVISESTAGKLMEMMKTAVESGTATAAQLEKCSAGGKTGSAETGWMKNGNFMQQGWFAGFFPADNPQYVCVVMVENGKSGSSSACPVFKEIGDKICQIAQIR